MLSIPSCHRFQPCCKQAAMIFTKENRLHCSLRKATAADRGANTDTSQGRTKKAVNFTYSYFLLLFHFFHNASLMYHKRYNIFWVNFWGEVKGWILSKEKLQKLGNLHQCILIEGPLQYLNYPCNLSFFTTEGEFSKSQHISYFCWVPSGGFSILVPAGYGKKL